MCINSGADTPFRTTGDTRGNAKGPEGERGEVMLVSNLPTWGSRGEGGNTVLGGRGAVGFLLPSTGTSSQHLDALCSLVPPAMMASPFTGTDRSPACCPAVSDPLAGGSPTTDPPHGPSLCPLPNHRGPGWMCSAKSGSLTSHRLT